jgi:hypothetical protein
MSKRPKASRSKPTAPEFDTEPISFMDVYRAECKALNERRKHRRPLLVEQWLDNIDKLSQKMLSMVTFGVL